jgi:hypothetical protein
VRAAAALAVLLLAVLAAGSARAADPPPAPPEVETTLTPQILLFGDTLTARVDALVNKRRLDPGSVEAEMDFSPWELVGPVKREEKDGGTTALVRTTWVLRCLSSPCVPPRDTAPLDFDPVIVRYGENGRLDVPWPRLVVHSRVADRGTPATPAGGGARGGPQFPWTADLLTLPSVSYRISPVILFPLLLVLGVLLVAAGGYLVYRAWPERKEAPEPVVEVTPEPAIPPLIQALALLEQPPAENGTADRRRALELVADALESADPRLARSARRLAWREETPPVETTSGLASEARTVLFPDGVPDLELEPELEPEQERVDA